MAIDRETVLEIGRLEDPLGVLSVYVDADPSQQASERPAWQVAVGNELKKVQERVRSEGPRERWTAVLEAIDGLDADLRSLLEPGEPGRGRALFATLAGGDVRSVALQLALPTRVVLERKAYIRPLVAALEGGRPTGLATVSRSGVRLLEWQAGEVESLAELDFEEATDDWREMKGPAGANPSYAQQTAPQHDRFERRLDDKRARFLGSVARRLQSLAVERGWGRILIAGDRRLTEPLEQALDGDRELIVTDRSLEALDGAELAEAVAADLERSTRERSAALAERARGAALAGGPGALGLADTLTSLAEGRVAHLLFDQGRDYRGARAQDGRLFPEGVSAPGLAASELVAEPLLGERMIERALETGAEVTTLTDPEAELLADCGGVAAILRW